MTMMNEEIELKPSLSLRYVREREKSTRRGRKRLVCMYVTGKNTVQGTQRQQLTHSRTISWSAPAPDAPLLPLARAPDDSPSRCVRLTRRRGGDAKLARYRSMSAGFWGCGWCSCPGMGVGAGAAAVAAAPAADVSARRLSAIYVSKAWKLLASRSRRVCGAGAVGALPTAPRGFVLRSSAIARVRVDSMGPLTAGAALSRAPGAGAVAVAGAGAPPNTALTVFGCAPRIPVDLNPRTVAASAAVVPPVPPRMALAVAAAAARAARSRSRAA
jgi:hypothetical protein